MSTAAPTALEFSHQAASNARRRGGCSGQDLAQQRVGARPYITIFQLQSGINMRNYLLVIICVAAISHVSADEFEAPADILDSSEKTGLTATEAINFEVPDPSELNLDFSLERNQLCFFRPAPTYPPESRHNDEQGTVFVKMTISSDGSIEAGIKRSSNYPMLDVAAIQAVKTWRCHRPVKGGKPITVVAVQPFNFSLEPLLSD